MANSKGYVHQQKKLVRDADNLEEIGLHPCSVGHFAHRGRQKKTGPGGEAAGRFGACPSTAVVVGTWLI
jgi:hypothetical protein